MRIADHFKTLVYLTSCLVLSLSALGFIPNNQVVAAPIIKIAFSSDRVGDGGGDIFIMNENGSNPINVSNGAATDFDYYPTWSPDGKKIAFTKAGLDYQIYSMKADGSSQTNLTNNGLTNDIPKWSPDGSKIAFTDLTTNDIYTMNPDGSNQTKITDAGSGQDGFFSSWSPDSTKIAFLTQRDDGITTEIYTMNADGSSQTRITNNSASEDYLAWSPDGSKIAFMRTVGGEDHIFVMNADGSNQTDISTPGTFNYQPAWSPDGSKIAFVSDRDGNYDIYTMNSSDGSNVVNLTNNTDYNDSPSYAITGDTVVPNNGDANGDGVFDVLQSNVTPMVNPVTGEYAVLESSCSSNTSLSIVEESSSSMDAGFDYPVGLMDFTLDCGTPGATATVTQYYYGSYDVGSLVMRKFNSSGGSYTTIDGASISSVTIGGQSVLKVIYDITDGGELDQDGVADGIIVDPSGPGIGVVEAPNTGLGLMR